MGNAKKGSRLLKKAMAYNENDDDDAERGWNGGGSSGMTSQRLNYSTRNNNRR